MKKKIVLTLYDRNGRDETAKSLSKYEDLYKYAEKKNIIFCRAPISSFDAAGKFFKRAQFFDGTRWLFRKNIIPDIVFDKTPYYLDKKYYLDRKLMSKRRAISAAYPFYNSLELSELLSNKWLTCEEFKNFSPKALLIYSRNDLEKINELSSKKIIVKPISGSGGKGIKIFDKCKIGRVRYPFFAQELVEVKKGVPGFVKGAHDLRVIIANEKPFYSFLRIPQKNKLISNLSHGGSVRVVPLEKLPTSIMPFIKKIQKKIRKYKTKLYSVDMIIDDNQRPWIIEMNSRPGILLEKEELPYREYFFDNLINFFKQIR